IQAAAVLTYLYRANGDLPNALAAAETSGAPLRVDWVLYEMGDWRELAKRWNRPDRPTVRPIEDLGYRAAFHRRGGNTTEFEKTISTINQYAKAELPGSFNAWYAAEALFLNDRSEEGLAMLIKGKYYLPAMEILVAQLRFREGFELADRAKKESAP